MSKIEAAIHEIHYIEKIARRDQWVNQIHPLVKLFITISYIVFTVSFDKYNLFGLLAMAVYPFVLFQLAEISFREALWRLRVVLPLVCIMGIFNPIFDHTVVIIEGTQIPGGILSMITLMIKGVFTVLGAYLLIASTTIEKICCALRMIHIPSILVTEILLIDRYITVLLGEVNRISQAYSLRAPKQKGIHFKVWGSLTGQLLLRSIDRANEVYESMTLRGYQGEFHYTDVEKSLKIQDICFLVIWFLLFILFRKVPVLLFIGNLVGGLFV